MKVLLTGGSGFIASHCLEALLKHGHEVVTTVRSPAKGQALVDTFKGQNVSYTVVNDIAALNAFDEAVISEPPFEAVVHTASPFHYEVKDAKKDMLDPAILGTTGILESIRKSAKAVKKVVITSSFAAILNPSSPPKVYNETIWNEMTMDEALTTDDPQAVYRASKTFAERAAWEFVAREKPNFTLTVLNPPMVYGPVRHALSSLEDLNTSSKRILNLILGRPRGMVSSPIYVDVRDLAEAHALAITIPEAAGQRILVTAGLATEGLMGDIVRRTFPGYAQNLSPDLSNTLPAYEIDSSKSIRLLKIKYRDVEDTVVDTVKSLQALGA
ncbi:dihydroflavonol-4-reductase [Exophiala aquamarina CBS 119918]|uniref:Dihydroflavonol-4-reductase n=1 Tax=Exophiala aquamarina CBS 119918 TaxID=1182545 RepID=A0A072PHP6_9EURO|nr:dihydroflavonol-4-reductase [Exophiala aquamarina CBS 119918]KEF58803.1 dihydroflavonol-4-reductase [Exophiala aquamarina CBS 119918]